MVTKEINDLALKKWKTKRKVTTILAMFHVGIFGLEYSAITISALYYFKDTLHAQNPALFYSLAVGAMFSSATISSAVLGKYMDVNRNARLIVIGTVTMAVLGNFMYCTPYSPWIPVAGRFLCGFSDAIMPVMTGEFKRCYKESEFNTVVYVYQIIYFTSFTIGPFTPLLFENVDIHWFIQIDQNVCIGLFLMAVQLIFVIVAYFCLYNLSNDLGYEIFMQIEADKKESNTGIQKEVTAECNNGSNHNVEATNKYIPIKYRKDLLSLKDIITDIDIMLVIFSCSLLNLSGSFMELQINMFSVNILKWSLNRLSGLTFAGIGFSVLFTTITHKQILKNSSSTYFSFFSCLVGSLAATSLFMFINGTRIQFMLLEILIFCLICILYLFIFGTLAFGRYLLFSLVPSHSASQCEGLRMSSIRISSGLAYFLAAPTFEYLFTLYFILNGIVFVFCCLFHLKRNTFTTV